MRRTEKELHCVFVNLDKPYDWMPRDELWCCVRTSAVAEKYVRVVKDMYDESETAVRCVVGGTDRLRVGAGLHHGSTVSLFLFSVVMVKRRERGDGWSLRADVHDKCHLLHNIVRVMHIVPAAFLHMLKNQHRQFLVLVYPQTVY